ncbi:hypothetical protein M3Y97_00605500 [Aphelenchoides bicaudatus]|nr:hypothetical protein M3Y97_00605500 [Aphelenchoides bicaudatus]
MSVDDRTLEATIRALNKLDIKLSHDIHDEADDFEQLTGQMIPMREDQVLNNAGGYVFEVTDQMRVRRFLILGSSGGTYYVSESDLKEECVEDLIRIIKAGKGDIILKEIFDINKDNRAPKKDYMLYALALCARYGTKDWSLISQNDFTKYDGYIQHLQASAFRLVPYVCKMATNLFMFIQFAEKVSKQYNQKTGWGRMMKSAVACWYLKRQPKTLAIQLTKYRNRCGYTHRDNLRLSHADPKTISRDGDDKQAILYDYLFYYACTGKLDKDFGDRYDDETVKTLKSSDVAKFMNAVLEIAKLKPENENECAQLIRENQLVREHVPTDLLNSATVWKALLEKMPMTAMIRNLSKMSALGLLTGQEPENQEWVDRVVENLTNEEKIKKAGIHPFNVLLAKSVYNQGSGVRGSLTFRTNPVISQALETAFLLAFKNVQPTNKRFLIALDVSGSMSSPMSGSVLSCREAEIAMSMVALRTEPKTEVVGFSSNLAKIDVNQETSFNEFYDKINRLSFDSTDCSLPMVWAKNEKKEFDVFIVYTDNETYFGNIHPFEALKQYRESSGIKDAKLIVVAFTGSKFTIADPTDPGMLDVVGFDSASPQLMAEFINGNL